MSDFPLAVVGCDFRIAGSACRSHLVLSAEEALAMADSLRNEGIADGFADLNTCNRNEWIVSSRSPRWATSLLRSQMILRAGKAAPPAFQPYLHVEEEAARHLFRVALGQESLVVGERQIAGQLLRAIASARERGSSSRLLNGLAVVTGRLARGAAREGCTASRAVGVHALAVAYLERFLGERSALAERRPRLSERRPGVPECRPTVAVVGLGRIGRQVLATLQRDGRVTAVPVNRTVVPRDHGNVLPLRRLPHLLETATAAMICTAAPEPVIRPADLPPRRPDRPLLLLDLGIPHQVTREGAPRGVMVRGLDELLVFHHGGASRQEDAGDRERLERLVGNALRELSILATQPSALLQTLQRAHRRLVRDELPAIISTRLAALSEEDRRLVDRDLRGVLRASTRELFRAIRSAPRERPW